mmetsp:Transcript_2635/g.4594  ORF Transcript_2635/g.4594 Transcript_2635/m.4594 type:complete len:461 (+) Transcript_2635:60-1442(+)
MRQLLGRQLLLPFRSCLRNDPILRYPQGIAAFSTTTGESGTEAPHTASISATRESKPPKLEPETRTWNVEFEEWSDIDAQFVPEGFPNQIARYFQHVKRSSLLYRAADNLLENHIAALYEKWSADPNHQINAGAVVLDGPRGSGKSASLLRAALAGRNTGWLTLYIPSLWMLSHGSGPYVPWTDRGIGLNVEGHVLWYERPEQVNSILQTFKKANEQHLGSIKVVPGSPMADRFTGDSLLKLINHGLKTFDLFEREPEKVPAELGDVLEELIRQLSLVESRPVMIALDEWNTILGLSEFNIPRARRIHSRAIRQAELFMDIDKLSRNMKNGLVIAALTNARPNKVLRKTRVVGGIDPRYKVTDEDRVDLMGETKVNALRAKASKVAIDMIGNPKHPLVPLPQDSHVFLACSPFCKEEVMALIREYEDAQFTLNVRPEVALRLHAVTGGRGHEIHKIMATM